MGRRTSTISQKNVTIVNFAQSHGRNRVSISFSRTISEIRNTGHSQFTREVEFRSFFHAPSQKFKIQTITNVLAHGKSYKHDFVKKCDGHKLRAKSRAKSSFNQFFVHRLRNSKHWQFSMY
ncbi:hypothetical protein B296_00037886 [Ensete ventricosum]|uniref:Uncharacterized protein n=1 Tax=Ensete ventricosum TaxID=4639 RepID=A0A426XWQ2_ENSVE|nr:hypothetical protein B296_00037886 [Ensete ventricosum]